MRERSEGPRADGLLLLDKKTGITSHDAVERSTRWPPACSSSASAKRPACRPI